MVIVFRLFYTVALILAIMLLYVNAKNYTTAPEAHMKINSDCFIVMYSQCSSDYKKKRTVFERADIHDTCVDIAIKTCKEDDIEFRKID